jgi:hypothetical protein
MFKCQWKIYCNMQRINQKNKLHFIPQFPNLTEDVIFINNILYHCLDFETTFHQMELNNCYLIRFWWFYCLLGHQTYFQMVPKTDSSSLENITHLTIKYLNLKFNDIRYIDNDTFLDLRHMTKFDISRNVNISRNGLAKSFFSLKITSSVKLGNCGIKCNLFFWFMRCMLQYIFHWHLNIYNMYSEHTAEY